MSQKGTRNLSKQKIQQLLAAVGSGPVEENAQIQTTEYNWHQPHYFSKEQIKKIESFATKFSTDIADIFTSLCQNDFHVKISSVSQHFASEFINRTSDNEPELFMSFGASQAQQCGVVVVPSQSAVSWAKQLLGETENKEDENKELSQMEVSLLSDIGSGIVRTLSNSHDSFDFHPARSFMKGQLPLRLEGPEELCKIEFNVKKIDPENETTAYLLILCSKLDVVTEYTATGGGQKEISPAAASKAMLQHIEKMNVSTMARLASIQVTFDQVLNLQVNDILVLNKKVDEPIELLVEGQSLYQGWLAKSAGQYAIVFK